MRCLFSFVLYFACALLIPSVRSQVTFTQPPSIGPLDSYENNVVFGYGSKIPIQWTGDIPEDVESLNLWCKKDTTIEQPLDVIGRIIASDLSTSETGIWGFIISQQIDLSDNGKTSLYYELYDGENEISLGRSHYFNVTREPPSTTTTTITITATATGTATSTTSASSTGAVTSATSTASTTSNLQESSTAVPDQEPQSTKNLSKKAVAGIAVGATIGGLLVLGLLGFLVWRYKYRNKSIPYHTAELPADSPTELSGGQQIKGSGVQIQSDDYRGPYAAS